MKNLTLTQSADCHGGFLINPFLTAVWLLEDVLGVDLPYDHQGPDPNAN